MPFFLIMAPFFTTAVAATFLSMTAALLSGAAVALALMLRDHLLRRSTKLLNVAVVAVFGTLGLAMWLTDTEWSRINIRLFTDGALLAVILTALAAGFPFTLQYAREQVVDDIARRPEFRRSNYILTWVWVGALVLMLFADMMMLVAPQLPLWIGIGTAYLVRLAAIQFTKWYPNHLQAKQT
jgi:hypothetical protein